MKKSIFKNRIRRLFNNNRGTTLIEMVVCFLLLAIFMVSASIVISSISSLYFSIKSELYADEVADIILSKVESEIDGAMYYKNVSSLNPKMKNDSTIDVCDKTDTLVNIGENNKRLEVNYYKIEVKFNGVAKESLTKNATTWKFDDNMYNGYDIEELSFYKGGENVTISDAGLYGLSSVDMSDYSNNVVLVVMRLHSDKYSEHDYYYHRFIKLYNVPQDYAWPVDTDS